MWIWHTDTNSLQCNSPLLTVEVVNIEGQLTVITGNISEIIKSPDSPETLGELLIYLDKWIENNNIAAAGIIGSECRALLSEKLHWVTDVSSIIELVRGESLVFVMQAGDIDKFRPEKANNNDLPKYAHKNQLVIDEETVEEINNIVTHGLEIRQKLNSDHLVVSVRVPINVSAPLVDSWASSVQTLFRQGFLMLGNNWELVSCTPERFISIADSKLQVQILAGTYKHGTEFDLDSLIDEHQAARKALRHIVEDVVGGLELTVDSDLVEFGDIRHIHSVFEKPYQDNISILWTLANLTPSPATGAQDNQTRSIIQQLEGSPRGYYGGTFFLRTPGCLESLVSIRSIFRLKNSGIGEIIVGAGLKKGSTLSSESAELISKATICAKLMGAKL